jgi:subtilisin family serine protease
MQGLLFLAAILFSVTGFANPGHSGKILARLNPGVLSTGFLATTPGIQKVTKLPLVPDLYELEVAPELSARALESLTATPSNVMYAFHSKKYHPLVFGKSGKLHIYGPNNPPVKDVPALPNPPKKDPVRGGNWNIPFNGVHAAWKHTRGAGVVVAVIDTGMDYNHIDLQHNLWHNKGESGFDANGLPKESNHVDDDGNGYVDDFMGYDFAENDNLPFDDIGHGTHVSGIIAATSGNGEGGDGVAPEARIMPLRFITASGSGEDADAIRALAYAAKNGAKIINNSWGGPEDNPALGDAFKALEKSGILIVNAAGNEGQDIGVVPMYPARYKLANTITVAANATRNTITWWSNVSTQFVQTSSAGYEIFSTLPNDTYGHLSGTSMAAPNQSGTAALILSMRPDLAPERVKELFLKRDAKQPQDLGRNTQWHTYSHPGWVVSWLAKHPEWK